MKRLMFLALCVCLVTVSHGAAQTTLSDWPQFRGPGGLGISTDKGVPLKWGPNQNIAWKVNLPGAGSSSPVVHGSRIYLTAFTGKGSAIELHLLALNRADGKEVWAKKITPNLPEQGSIREEHGYASATPAVDATGIYCFFGKSGAIAFSHDGKELWRKSVGTGLHAWGSAASPVIHKEFVYINAGVESQSIVALDKRTGNEAWRIAGNKEDSWNTPIIVPLKDGRSELVFAMGGRVHGLDPVSGKSNWTCRTDIGWYMVPGLVTNNDIVYVLGGRSGVTALAVRAGGKGDVTKSHRLWTSTKGSNVSSPIYYDGHLYWMNDGLGIAYCAVASTGKVVYEERAVTGAGIYSSPVMADGRIYYVARNGKTYVVAAAPRYELLATNDIGESRIIFNSSTAVAGGKIYLRTDKYLYCIGN